MLGRGEEDALGALAEPERAADAAREVDDVGLAAVEPGRRHRALQRLERARVAARVGGERRRSPRSRRSCRARRARSRARRADRRR